MQTERIPLLGFQFAQAQVLKDAGPNEFDVTEMDVTAKVQYHIIIVPGNPGISTFYTPFAQELYQRLGRKLSVRIVNLAGFVADEHLGVSQCSSSHGGGGHAHSHVIEQPKVYSLQDECAFLYSYLQALLVQLEAADDLATRRARGLTIPNPTIEQFISPHIRPQVNQRSQTRQHRFILMCHSIGAYMGLDAMRRAALAASNPPRFESPLDLEAPFDYLEPPLELIGTYFKAIANGGSSTSTSSKVVFPLVVITHNYLIFPFIRMDLNFFHNRFIRLVLFARPLLRILARLFFGLIPISIWRLLLRWTMKITSDHAVQAIYDTYTNPHLADAAMYLGLTEFRDVAPPDTFPTTFLSNHAQRCTLYYAGKQHDIWGPIAQMKDFQRLIPNLSAQIVPTATHAWCAYLDQSSTMAELISSDVQRVMDQHAPNEDVTISAHPDIPLLPSTASALPPVSIRIEMKAKL